VPEQISDGLDVYPGLQPPDGRAVAQGVYSDVVDLPILAAAIWTVRRMLRGSTGVPTSDVNTRPLSVH
jgi:hypothetical protein